MKKIFYILASAIVALGAVACDNQDLDTLNPADGLTISATIDNTKVAFDEKLNASWELTDEITIDGFTFVQEEKGIFRCADEGVFEALVGKTKTAVCGTFDSTKGLEGTLFEAEGEIKAQGTSLAFAPANALLLVTAEEDNTILESENFSEDVILMANEPTYVPIMAGEDVTISYYVNYLKTKSLTADFVAGKVYQLGTLKPVEGGEETISFASTASRTTLTTSQQVWEQNGVILTNDKDKSTNDIADYSNPARFYKSSKLTIVAPGNITKIVFDCNTTAYATSLKTSIGATATATASSDKVTVTFDPAVESFVVTLSDGQVRMDALTVSYDTALADDRATQDLSFPEDEYTVTEGEEFEAPTATGAATTVTYSSSNEAIATVDENTGAVTLEGETGRVIITATAAENKNHKGATASYTLVVKSASLAGSGAGTEKDPFDVTRAIDKIDENAELDVKYYVKGTISEITEFESKFNSLTYKITDGEKTLEVYSGKNLDNTDFKATTDLHEGDVVVVCGTLKKYNDKYEFDYNNYLVSRECGHTDLEQTVTFSSTPESVEVGKTVTVSATAINTITYSSSNTSIATVDANGVVTGVAEGTVTITATAAAGNGYAQATATHTIEVVAASTDGDEPKTAAFVKVTSAPSDWSGTYLIVYETGKLAFDGSLSTLDATGNHKSVTIANSQIEATDAMKAMSFTIAKNGSNYTIKSASGYYIGNTSDQNKVISNTSTKYDNTLSLNTDGSVQITSVKSVLRFNSNTGNNNNRFRYYKSTTYTSQKAIQLYKLEE